MSKVTVYSTAGENNKVIEFDSSVITTFGQLKTFIGAIYPWNTASVLDEMENEYTRNEQMIPVTDFCLFVYPKETKSGIPASKLPYNAAKRKISELIKNSREANVFFTNYVLWSATEMNKKITQWEKMELEKAAARQIEDETISVEDIAAFINTNFGVRKDGMIVSNSSIASAIRQHFETPDLCQAKYYEIKSKKNL